MSDDWRLDWIISVDDHVLEKPTLWQERVPQHLRASAPLRAVDDEGEAWFFDGTRIPTYGLGAMAGKTPQEFSPNPLTYADMREGCYDVTARLADMDADHVIASLCFPSFPRFAGQLFSLTPNRELGLACVRAYNDWIIEEWAGAAPGRLIPLVIAPMWDGRLAAQELERCAGLGAKAVTFSENPEPLGYPSVHNLDHWGPFFSAANDTGIPICTHIGSSSQMARPSTDAPPLSSIAYQVIAHMTATLSDWMFGGHFLRYPNLKLCLSEGGIGWIPYYLEHAEQVYDKHLHWARRIDQMKVGFAGRSVDFSMTDDVRALMDSGLTPTELFREHVYGCFFNDRAGLEMLHLIGEDNVMVETDYPHSDSNWPNSMDVIQPQLKPLSDTTKKKVLQYNAMRVFDFEPAAPLMA